MAQNYEQTTAATGPAATSDIPQVTELENSEDLGGFDDDSPSLGLDDNAGDGVGPKAGVPPVEPSPTWQTRSRPVSGAESVGQLGPYPVLYDPEIRSDSSGYGFFRDSLDFDRRDRPARACRVCEMPLPENLSAVDVITIGVVGNQAAGKSHYLTAVLHEMINRQRLHALGIGTIDTVGDTADRFHERWQRVYRERLAHGRTTAMEGVQAMRKPIALQLDTVTGRHAMLMFHDVPGEWLVDPNQRARHFEYLHHLDGLIFIVDPLAIQSVRSRLEPKIDSRHFYDFLVPQHHLMSSMARELGERASQIPVSIVVNKGDMVEAAFEPVDELRMDEARNAADLVEQVRILHKVTKGQVFEWLDEPALEIAAERFPTAVYHLVSPIGTLPDFESGLINGDVRSSRVIDPVFRILREL